MCFYDSITIILRNMKFPQVSTERIDGIIRGIKALHEKYLESATIERIMKSESSAKKIHGQLLEAIQEIIEQGVFEGKCQYCPTDM